MICSAPDKFNRFHVTARIIQALRAQGIRNPTILDLGANENLLTQYLDGYRVLQADMKRENACGPFVLCRAERIPFADKSIDIVVCLDVLEHVPDTIRSRLIREISRIARHTAIIAFPADHDFTVKNESILQDIHTYLYHEPNRFLLEHRAHGLVDSRSVLHRLQEHFLYIRLLHVFSKHLWLLSHLIDHYLGILPKTLSIRRSVFALINSTSPLVSEETDAYRTFIVAGHSPLPELDETVLKPSTAVETEKAVLDSFRQSHEEISNLHQYARELETKLKRNTGELEQALHEAAVLKQQLDEHLSRPAGTDDQHVGPGDHYETLEQYCLHLESIIQSKDRMIVELQDQCTRLLVQGFDGKNAV